jgi:hypothetical protein
LPLLRINISCHSCESTCLATLSAFKVGTPPLRRSRKQTRAQAAKTENRM